MISGNESRDEQNGRQSSQLNNSVANQTQESIWIPRFGFFEQIFLK